MLIARFLTDAGGNNVYSRSHPLLAHTTHSPLTPERSITRCCCTDSEKSVFEAGTPGIR